MPRHHFVPSPARCRFEFEHVPIALPLWPCGQAMPNSSGARTRRSGTEHGGRYASDAVTRPVDAGLVSTFRQLGA